MRTFDTTRYIQILGIVIILMATVLLSACGAGEGRYAGLRLLRQSLQLFRLRHTGEGADVLRLLPGAGRR